MEIHISFVKRVSIAVIVSGLLAGCAVNQGTIAPPMPIPMVAAQSYAQQRQQGINVTRQFVGLWENAKHHMKNSFTNCIEISNANGGSPRACWQGLNQQAIGYANQFSGLYADGLQGAQHQHFSMARQSAVTYFQLLETYSKQCIHDLNACMSPNDPTKSAMAAAKKRVDDLLAGTITTGSAGAIFENGQVNDNLAGLSNSPTAVAPSAQVPSLQQR